MADAPPHLILRSNPTELWKYTVYSGKVYAIPPGGVIRLSVSVGSAFYDCVVMDEGVREITSREYADIQKAFLKLA